MKVKFLKAIENHKEGEVKEVEYTQARYWINIGFCKESKARKSTKELKINLETK